MLIFSIQRRERYSKEKCHFQPFVEADNKEEDRDEEENAKDGDEVRGNRTLLLWGFNPGNVNFEFIPN